jgi:tetratricopeptide (TPR) repeat protein
VQGGLVRLPSWAHEPNGKPCRPIVPLWLSLQRHVVSRTRESDFGSADPNAALQALVDFACDPDLMGCRPGKIEVNSAGLANFLAEALQDTGIQVIHRDSLHGVQKVMVHMAEDLTGGAGVVGAMSVQGMTLDRMRAFADAAAAFYRAAPWQRLMDEDPILIEHPLAQEGLGCVTVLGAGGRSYGLGFHASLDAYHRMVAADSNPLDLIPSSTGLWSVSFDPITDIPLQDSDLWLDHDLPVAGDTAYPWTVCYLPRGRARRPTPRTLSFLEGLLRVLATATEEQMDSGRWNTTVQTYDGLIEYRLALPELLSPPSRQEMMSRGEMPDRRATERMTAQIERYFDENPAADLEEANRILSEKFSGPPRDQPVVPFRNKLEEAQDLCYQATEAKGRRQVQLIGKALEICPDCADAYVLLAERTGDPQQASVLYAQGVEAGERMLGAETFREHTGQFWGRIATRPYMRARLGLAQSLELMDRNDEAVAHYRELLRLNPDDHQGVRHLLLPLLLRLGHDDEAAELLEKFGDEPRAVWAYGRALLEFRRSGDSPEARKALKRALKVNPYVPDAMFDDEDLPAPVRSYSPGGEEEAMLFAPALAEAWEATDGAMDWLDRRTDG